MTTLEYLNKLHPLPTPEEMSSWDREAINFGIPENMLMENSARAILKFLEQKNLLNHKPIWIFMGGGNNGGDAAALARSLGDAGCIPVVFYTTAPEKLHGAAAFHANLALKDGIPFLELPEPESNEQEFFTFLAEQCARHNAPGLIIDGLLGTGFRGVLRDGLVFLIRSINRLSDVFSSPLVSIDIPSGLNGLTGYPAPEAIRATYTLTLAAAKTGMILPQAREWIGELYFNKIGFPKTPEYSCSHYLLDGAMLKGAGAITSNGYKNIYGHILVFGGSSGMEGAAHLACMGALRSGCGLVTACAPKQVVNAIKNGQPEIMTQAVSDGAHWPDKIPDYLEEYLNRASGFVIGPGMGRTAETSSFLKALLNLPSRPSAVFDADSLILLGKDPELAARLTARDILTPHPGEAGALLNCSSKEIQADRTGALNTLKEKFPCAIALKGAATLAGQKGHPVLICPYDIPQLSVAGSGDVLSGIAGFYLGLKTFEALEACSLAIITHAISGLICARKFPDRGDLAPDLVDAIPEALRFTNESANWDLAGGRLPWPSPLTV